MTTKLELYNNALLLLGHSTLADLTEDNEARRILDTTWDNDFVRLVLEAGMWRFAFRSQKLTPEPSITPAFGYINGYQKGSDWVRTAAICHDEYFDNPLLRYHDEVDIIYADEEEIFVRFVSDDAAFGGDLSIWPLGFQTYAEAELAGKIARKLTSDKDTIIFLYGDPHRPNSGYIEKTLKEAKSRAAAKDPTRFFPPGSWTTARGRRGWRGPYGDGGTGGSLTG